MANIAIVVLMALGFIAMLVGWYAFMGIDHFEKTSLPVRLLVGVGALVVIVAAVMGTDALKKQRDAEEAREACLELVKVGVGSLDDC